jgi:tetratricopeptide (TPR) repeat protein
MRSSRLGIFVLLIFAVFLTSSCGYFNRILSRKNLVDGSMAYKERKFEEAEDLFRRAAARDPQGETDEGRIAQVFLARTLHSRYIGNRQDPSLAERAIAEYKKALAVNKNDQSSYKAVASLLENLGRTDEWREWVNSRSNAGDIKPEYRAEALTSLAAKQNTCANEISDTPATKKTVKGPDGKDTFQFSKPADAAEFERMKGCVAEGTRLIEQASSLETDTVKNAGSLNPKSMSDEQLKETIEAIKPFESSRSYRASLIIQSSRLAEMEGRNQDRDRLKEEADRAKEAFTSLSEVSKNLQNEVEARRAAAEAAANANAANNAAAK